LYIMTVRVRYMNTPNNTPRTIGELMVQLIEQMEKSAAELHAENEKMLSEFAEGDKK